MQIYKMQIYQLLMIFNPGESVKACCQEVCGERVLTGALSIYGLVCNVLLKHL